MISIILSLVTILYFLVSYLYLLDSNYAMSLVFVAYAIANIGLYFAGNLH